MAPMTMRISFSDWQIASLAGGAALAAGAGLWLMVRRRPTADEVEQERRLSLVSFGRIVDGMLLDSFQISGVDGTTRDMLLYEYEISGVSYQCSQDITALGSILDPTGIKVGMPCSIRYQPGCPENSILVAERWSGLREVFPLQWMPQVGQAPDEGLEGDEAGELGVDEGRIAGPRMAKSQSRKSRLSKTSAAATSAAALFDR